VELPLPLTFPRIFSAVKPSAKSAPVHSCLSTNSGIADWFRRLATPLGSGGSSAVTLSFDLPDEDREELRSNLLSMADAYVEGWESGSEAEEMDETE
jgi:hypothetical protein